METKNAFFGLIFWSPNKKLTGRRRKKEGEEEKEEEEEGGGANKGMETELKYECLTLGWNYECLNGILKFMRRFMQLCG